MTSVDSSTSLDKDGNIDSGIAPEQLPSTLAGKFTLRNLFRFDALNLRSSAWRNERMLASDNLESEKEEVSYVAHYGCNVCFHPKNFHYTTQELEPYRKIGDPEMDGLLDYLSQNSKEGGCGCGAFDDVVAHAAKEYQQNNTPSSSFQFYKHYYEGVPDWVDFDQIQRGIDVYLSCLPAAGCALFYRSLVGGFSIPKIVRVLSATRYLVPSHLASDDKKSSVRNKTGSIEQDRKRSLERLVDTGGFLASCFAPMATNDLEEKTQTAAALRPGGKGWEAALHVRVLHSKVRRTLLQSKKTDDDGQSIPRWDTERDGIPINQEDMAATLLAFSVNTLIGIEVISGRPLPETQQRDYLALWRYIGWLLGVDTAEGDDDNGHLRSSNAPEHDSLVPIDPCGLKKLPQDRNFQPFGMPLESTLVDSAGDSIIHSYATLESMILHLLHPEQSSHELVTHLLSLRSFFIFRSEVCRKLLGDPLSDELRIPKSSMGWKGWRKQSLVNFVNHIGVKFFLYFFLLFLRCYTLMTMSSPWIRSRAIVWHSNLWKKFLDKWEGMHSKRMSDAASAQQKGSMRKTSTRNSHCPFSMVMAPRSE